MTCPSGERRVVREHPGRIELDMVLFTPVLAELKPFALRTHTPYGIKDAVVGVSHYLNKKSVPYKKILHAHEYQY